MASKKTFFNHTWEAVSFIGEGNFGKVYKAKKIKGKSEEFSAIKNIVIKKTKQDIDNLINEGLSASEIKNELKGVLDKCVSEIKLMQKLKGSTNIVNIEDCEIISDDTGYGWEINIRMELLQTLDDYLDKKEITNLDIIKLGIDISKALDDCEKVKIIHRDIKPDNIFVNALGDYKLGDFGIARNLEKTMSGLSQKGTFNYIAPEVYKGNKYNKTVDIYSLGIVLYKYFNYNRLPFLPNYPEKVTVQDRNNAILYRAEGKKIPSPINASELESSVILKMISYTPKDRYHNAKELHDALKQLLDEKKRLLPIVEKKVSSKEYSGLSKHIYHNKRFLKKKVVIISISIFLLILLPLGILFYNNLYVMVPNILGYDSMKAVQLLQKEDLVGKIKYQEVTSNKKVGKVIEQNIKNRRVKKKSKIILTVGISNEKVVMPNLLSCTKDEAQDILEKKGLKPSFLYEYDSETDKDDIISQMIPAGTKVNKGTVVEVLVSKGKDSSWSTWLDKLPSDISDDSTIEKRTVYSYRTKETTTSSNSSLNGWTLYDTKGENTTREVTKELSSSEYNSIKNNAIVVDSTISQVKFNCYICKNGNDAPSINYQCSSGSLSVISQEAEWNQYIDNGRTRLVEDKYGTTYLCRIGDVTPSRWNVTYKEQVSSKIYYYYKWSSWSDYQESKVFENSNRQVRTKTQYRYKKK